MCSFGYETVLIWLANINACFAWFMLSFNWKNTLKSDHSDHFIAVYIFFFKYIFGTTHVIKNDV